MSSHLVTAHIPAELDEALDMAASRLERSREWAVKQALRNWVDLEQRRHQMTLDALREADEGKFVEHEQIEIWLAGLE